MFNFKKVFLTKKPIIAMCHLLPLPDDPKYDEILGIEHIINHAKKEIEILQNNGVHGLLISNEFSYPYSQNVSQITVASMARIIGELRKNIKVPFGVDCMYDAFSTIDLAVATGANFYRITLNPASVYDYELGRTQLGDYIRHANRKNLKDAKCLINIEPSLSLALKSNNIDKLFNSVLIQANPDALCISSKLMTYLAVEKLELLHNIRDNTLLFCDGGCNKDNIKDILMFSDGAIVGTTLKKDGELQNAIDESRLREFLSCINNI